MFDWDKLGLVFSPQQVQGRPWMHAFAQAPASLLLDDAIRIYFTCRPPADAHGQYVSRAAWVDLDRRDPTRILRIAEHPIMPLGGVGEFDEFGTYPVSVALDGALIRAYYAGWTRCESIPFNVGIGMATSHDGGLTFTKHGRGPIIPYSPDEPFVISGPKIRRFNGGWQLWYIAGKSWIKDQGRAEPIYRIRMATSTDGVSWTKVGRDLIPPRHEEDEPQASPDVYFRDGIYHMFFCYRRSRDYRNQANGYRIGYAWSDDMLTWQRDDDRAGLDVSANGWDAEMVNYPHVFEVDGTVYLAYTGNQVGRQGFGLARLRHWPATGK